MKTSITDVNKKWKAIMDNNISEIEALKPLMIFAKILGFNYIRLTSGYVYSYLEVLKDDYEFSYWKCRIPYSSTYAEAIINILSFVEKENHKLIFHPDSSGNILSKNAKISISKNSPEFLMFKFECSLRGIDIDEVVKNE